MFGLHPALEPLVPFWTAGKVAAVHATGLPAPNRSHFAAMEEVEDADPGSSVRSGWLNRLVGTDADANPLQGLNLGRRRRAGLAVRPAARDVGRQRRTGWASPATTTGTSEHRRIRSLHTLWDGNTHRARPRDEVDVRRRRRLPGRQGHARRAGQRRRVPRLRPRPARSPEVARVIKGDVGVAVLTVDQGDWDHHTDIGTVEWGRLVQNAGDLAGRSPPSSPTSARGPTRSPS